MIGAALLSNHIIIGLWNLTIESKQSIIFMDEIAKTTPKPYYLDEMTIWNNVSPYFDENLWASLLKDHSHLAFLKIWRQK